jgi:hypothetical protein
LTPMQGSVMTYVTAGRWYTDAGAGSELGARPGVRATAGGGRSG